MKIAIDGMVIDSFAGGGGAGLGIAWALGRSADLAINHDAAAMAMYQANHPDTRTMHEDVWMIDPRRAIGRRREVALLWASPDCKDFSRAKGDKPVSKNIRSLAWVVIKWADQVRPHVIILENVREFEGWGPVVPAWKCAACQWKGTEGQAVLKRHRRRCPRCDSLRLKMTDKFLRDPKREGLTFKRWVGRLRNLGYRVEWKTLNAADFGAPTHRRRLFLVGRRDGLPIIWPQPTHGNPKKLDEQPLFARLKPWRTAAECIDWDIPCPSIFDRKKPLAEATMRRIAMGIKRYVLENAQPFIVRFRGSPGGCKHALVAAFLAKHFGGVVGHEPDRPIGTVTAKDHHSLVAANLVRFNHDDAGVPIDGPLPTVTVTNHAALVHTVTEIECELYVIADIGMRMLTPRELARAQGFPDTYVLTGSKTSQVARIGNSVPPVMAKVLVEANLVTEGAAV